MARAAVLMRHPKIFGRVLFELPIGAAACALAFALQASNAQTQAQMRHSCSALLHSGADFSRHDLAAYLPEMTHLRLSPAPASEAFFDGEVTVQAVPPGD